MHLELERARNAMDSKNKSQKKTQQPKNDNDSRNHKYKTMVYLLTNSKLLQLYVTLPPCYNTKMATEMPV